jgi:hypothetical protein
MLYILKCSNVGLPSGIIIGLYQYMVMGYVRSYTKSGVRIQKFAAVYEIAISLIHFSVMEIAHIHMHLPIQLIGHLDSTNVFTLEGH